MFGKFSPRYLQSPAVTIGDDTVTKRPGRCGARTEVGMTELARSLGAEAKLFRAAKVLGFNESTGTIRFERIEGFETLGRALAEMADSADLLRRTGAALGYVHAHLAVPGALQKWASIRLRDRPGDLVALHGDFNTMNVGCTDGRTTIVVLDWSSAPWLGPPFTAGSRYIDLASFLRSLVLHQASFPAAVRRFRRRAEAFLQGYEAQSGQTVDLPALGGWLLHVSRLHLRSVLCERTLWRRGVHLAVGAGAHALFKRTARRWRAGAATCPPTQPQVSGREAGI